MGRRKHRFLKAIAAVMIAAAPCLGQGGPGQSTEPPASTGAGQIELPQLGPGSTLPDYLTYAALNNPELEAAFSRWKAALEQIPQARALPDPRFTYRYFIQEIETRVGPQRQAFEISQMFPWFGKRALAGDIAARAAQAAQQRYEAVKLKLFLEVKEAYYEYYYLTRSTAVTQENVELLTHLEEVARTRYRAAAGSHPDVIRAQVELGRLEDRFNSLQDLRRPMMARLNAALNRPVEAELPEPKSFEPRRVVMNDRELLESLETLNPQLRALSHEAQRYAQATELAKKQYAPDVTIGLSYVDVDRSDLASRFADNGKDAIGAMVSLNIPLWPKKTHAAVREARLRQQATVREKTDTANRLKTQLTMALYRFRDAERKLDLYDHALVPKATEALKVTEQAFRSGTGSFLDLIDGQRIFLEFELARARALADHEQSLARIEMLVGRDIAEARDPDHDSQ